MPLDPSYLSGGKNKYVFGSKCCHQEQRVPCASPSLGSGARGSAQGGACEARHPLELKKAPRALQLARRRVTNLTQGELASSSCKDVALTT